MTTVVGTYGGGTNSTAMYIGMVDKGYAPPHAIRFADTGGEWPETYENVQMFSDWLVERGYPAIDIVRRRRADGSIRTLEQECIEEHRLPSIAYGFKTCSQKYKVQPQERADNRDPVLRAAWKAGERVVKLIGYHYGEVHRARFQGDKKYDNCYPLIDWQWKQDECMAVIRQAGFSGFFKSACFFCPQSKNKDIDRLRAKRPELLARALAMERGAYLTTIKGLGRRFSWAEYVELGIFAEGQDDEMPCGCYDGDA